MDISSVTARVALDLLKALTILSDTTVRRSAVDQEDLKSHWKSLCFISICKFGSFKNPFAMVTSLSKLYFRIGKFILLVKAKKVISLSHDSSASSWKPWRWVRLNLIFSMRDIYINSNLNQFTEFTSSSRSTKFKDILLWNISQAITKTVPISTRIVRSCVMKWGISMWIWWKANGNWDKNMIRISQLRESHCRTNISIRRKYEIAGVWESQSGIQARQLTIWVRSLEIEKL